MQVTPEGVLPRVWQRNLKKKAVGSSMKTITKYRSAVDKLGRFLSEEEELTQRGQDIDGVQLQEPSS